MKHTFPVDYDTAPCYIVAINRSLIPIVAGTLRMLESRGAWGTSEDYERGYNAIVEVETDMASTCINVLLEKSDTMYRMLDTALYGRDYAIVSSDPIEVSPAISPTHSLVIEDNMSVLGQLRTMGRLVDNSINGTVNDEFSDTDGVKQKLQSVIDALGTEDTDLASIITTLEQIALLVA